MIRLFFRNQRVPTYIERITPAYLHATFEHWLTFAFRVRGLWVVMPLIERKNSATIFLNGNGEKVVMTGGPTLVVRGIRGFFFGLNEADPEDIRRTVYEYSTIERLARLAPNDPEAAAELAGMGITARLTDGGVAWTSV